MLSISISATPPEEGGGIEIIFVAPIGAAHGRALDGAMAFSDRRLVAIPEQLNGC
jgi:hypothetical protein